MADPDQEPIAVIGMACRFPGGADSPSKLWELLRSPRDLKKRVPIERFDIAGFYHTNGSQHGATDVTTAYFLEGDVKKFDNAFFNNQPAEADAIDPQQRLLMETVYDSLCAGGQTIEQLQGSKTAVYVGQMCGDWEQMTYRDWDLVPTYSATGTSRAIMSNRVSYFFDWHGPSMTIDTACSSSLVAVHQAVRALRNGDSSLAVAAGSNLILAPGMFIAESKLHMLSPTGTSKMWDAAADGYARGEGVAAVILKKLSDALRDGDPIECVIRGTGVNQDGKTAGLTVPSNIAQADLIRDTYARAKLDINDPKDRPQYFHAHGTGTPAGDPQEAEAISRVFFESGKVTDKLYVGSIKTVIGHTEGTAGLASLIGSVLAIQHGVIPPNLYFNTLSPSVAPFCDHLKVPITATPWPETFPGQPRRASVNSFGFGGTNAHVILEQYLPDLLAQEASAVKTADEHLFTPLTVSAASVVSLRAALDDLRAYLVANSGTSLRDLAYTLQVRRSTLPFRVSIVASTAEEALKRLDDLLAEQSEDGGDKSMIRRYYDVPHPRILGVFTGQGAQWARMGARLLQVSPFATQRIAELQRALSTLQDIDRPDWTLHSQLLADSNTSRLAEAAIAQPLCTAVQIVLVDLLQAAGIRLRAVVGHSSGEIGAAYAAGFLSSTNAIRVAYFRGRYAKLAGSRSGAKGAMMVVGTSFEGAQEFCELETFKGRLQVAARNSPSSITLSGDNDAVEEALAIFQDEGKFARALRVDTAYHSVHMLPCAEPYLASLAGTGYSVQDGNGTVWFSSVINGGGHIVTKHDIQSPKYWVDNMTSPVLFEPAIQAATAAVGPVDVVVEIGPHPALRGPILDTIQEVAGGPVPYTCMLARGKDDVDELASAIGFLWTQLGAASVDFDNFERTITSSERPRRVLVGLPTYPFDHSRSFGSLTRFSGGYRHIHAPPHPLLGRRLLESETTNEISWRNVLRSSEIGWLRSHALQGQIVFPATGYISAAVEAVAAVAADSGRSLGVITLRDVVIGRAITFPDDNAGMETKVTLRIDLSTTDDELSAHIAIYSGMPSDTGTPLALNFTTAITAAFHEPQADSLPATCRSELDRLNLVNVDEEKLYSQFVKLGYNYSPPFTGMRLVQRKLGFATGEIEDESGDAVEDKLLLHPGWLDSSIQTGFAAYSQPHDNRLFTLFMPTAIRSVVINPYYLSMTAARRHRLHFQTTVHAGTPEASMEVDVDLFAGGDGLTMQAHPFLQFDSLKVRPLTAPTARDDAVPFSRFSYGLPGPDSLLAVVGDELEPPERRALCRTLDRVAFYYLRRLHETITPAEREAALPHFQHLLDYSDRLMAAVGRGENPAVPREALDDSPTFVRSLIAKYHDRTDFQMAETVGEKLAQELRRGGYMLEHMMKDGLLDRFYEDMAGIAASNRALGRIVAQISHRYPRMNIFEIGAGTGATTVPVLAALKGAFSSYTFTDVGAGFLPRAQERFAQFEHIDRMVFATFDVERPAKEQGFEPHTYDVVIACNVLHATASLDETVANARTLLRPGGYLVVLEIVTKHPILMMLTMGGLPGWWNATAAGDQTRPDGPCVPLERWDEVTRRNGFGGIDTHTPITDDLTCFSVWAAQAVDEYIAALRAPLASPIYGIDGSPGQLLIVGGRTQAVAELADGASAILMSCYANVTRLKSLEDLDEHGLTPGSAVVVLAELDGQLLETRTESKINALKQLWRNGGSILWVSRGARGDRPYSSMTLGLARVVSGEYPHVNLQVLDFDGATEATPRRVAEALVRHELGGRLERSQVRAGLLWTLEREMYYVGGRLQIPRMLPDVDANKRYNSYRRAVEHEVDLRDADAAVVLEPIATGGGSVELATPSPLRVLPPAPRTASGQLVKIRVKQSLLQVFKVQDAGYLALLAGSDANAEGKRLVALAHTAVGSTNCVPAEWTLAVPNSMSSTALVASLASTGARLLARSIIAAAPRFGTVLVHEANEALRDSLDRESTSEGVRVFFTTAVKSIHASVNGPSPYTFVHGKLPLRHARKLLPRDVSLLVDLSSRSPSAAAGDAADLIARALPLHTSRMTEADFLRATPGLSSDADVDVDQAGRILKTAWQAAAAAATRRVPTTALPREPAPVLPLKDIRGVPVISAKLSVVDWTASPSVRAVVRGIDHGNIFRGDGTYFLIGLAGEIGQSLCAWMVVHGASAVVLGSRRPKVDPRFIESLAAEGAIVKVVSVDVGRRESLRAAYAEICADMPPVIGVANGAMVLEDALFDDLDFASLERTAPPKIDGSVFLDELFYDTPLEFFVLFTSTAQILGNGGQSAYVMANQFMTALAAQRRDVRGVAGSDMVIGSVSGLGYAHRTGHLDSNRASNRSIPRIAERDLHELFAEAVLAGRPENKHRGISQVASGVSPFHDTPETHPALRNNPLVSHFVLHDSVDHSPQNSRTGIKMARLRARLATVSSLSEAKAVVYEAFVSRLRVILMVPQEEKVDDTTTLPEQGIDSIMAVELRTWFLQELGVDLPMLKILGVESTVKSLVEVAVSRISPQILDLDSLDRGRGLAQQSPGPVADAAASLTESLLARIGPEVTPKSSPNLSPEPSADSSMASMGTSNTSAPPTPLIPPEPLRNEPTELAFGNAEHKKELTRALEVQEEARRKSILAASTEIAEQMTYGQKRFWFLDQYIEEPTTFNIAHSLRLEGPLRVDDLAHAVEAVAQRHEALRTRFFWSKDGTHTPMQGVLSKTLVRLETTAIQSIEEATAELEAMREYRWDRGDWVQLRLHLLRLSDTVHYLIIGAPHISIDGHSISILMMEINQAYGEPGRLLPPLPAASQPRAFGKEQLRALSTGEFRHAIDYHRRALQLLDLSLPVELLPFARSQMRHPLERYVNNIARARLSPETAASLKQLARSHKATSFHVYLAALQALLFRLLPPRSTDKVVIGIADANRLERRFMGTVGNLLNVLPLVIGRTSQTFGQAVEAARQKVYGALEHSALPFDLLLDELAVPRSSAHSPVFQIFVDYKLIPREQAEMRGPGYEVTESKGYTARSPYDIAIEIADDREGGMVTVYMQDALYSQEATGLFLRSYINLLNQVTRHDGGMLSVDKLAKWDAADLEQALKIGKGPHLPFEWPSTFAHRFDDIVARHPDNIALKDGYGQVMTYAELNERVDDIARALRAKLPDQSRHQSVVGVFQTPAADWIASLLAIFRIGAIYLPLDLKVSAARLEAYVAATHPTAILADSKMVDLTGQIGIEDPAVINVSTLPATAKRGNWDERITTAARPDRPAYIIFTSGSTGKPKGVVVKHESFHALAEGFVRHWDVTALGRVVLQQFPLTSDGSLKQILSAIGTGGTLVVAPESARGDPIELTRLMAEHRVTFAVATPSEWGMWFRFAPDNLRRCTSLTSAWFGGERPARSLLDSFRDLGKTLPDLRFFNTYGPTEASISTVKGEVDVCDPGATVPVPSDILPNYAVYILDSQSELVPPGVPGEIVIGGAGVGDNEYLDQPELTAEQFPEDHFVARSENGGRGVGRWGRVYRSGDYGRLDSRGRLTVEGRVAGDAQVQVRGFRVELGEIEGIIIQEAHGFVTQAVVTVRAGQAEHDDGLLVAHVMMSHDGCKTKAQATDLIDKLRTRLHAVLPQYMVPAVIVSIDDVPLTAHGKVDRGAVQALPLFETKTPAAGRPDAKGRPLTPAERLLADLWASILPAPALISQPLSPSANFFHLGGNSLLLVKLQATIKRAVGDAPRLTNLMNTPDLSGMATLLENEGTVPDWDKEIAVERDLLDQAPAAARTIAAGLRILVTGATGFLGRHIVSHLVADGRVAEVIALVRPAQDRDPAGLFPDLKNGHKLHVALAELPALPAEINMLVELDVILHIAADRNFWDGYGALRPVNVNAVKELAKLALSTGAPLHVLSSGAVAGYEADGDDNKGLLPRPDAANGYVSSKWVAERYLAAAARLVDLHITVHRPSKAPSGLAHARASSAELSVAESALTHHMLLLSPQLGTRPDFTGLGGTFHVAVVDDVARAVAAAATAGHAPLPPRKALRVVEYQGTGTVRADDAAARMEVLLAQHEHKAVQDLPAVPALQWFGRAKRAGLLEWLFTAQELVVTDERGRTAVSTR